MVDPASGLDSISDVLIQDGKSPKSGRNSGRRALRFDATGRTFALG